MSEAPLCVLLTVHRRLNHTLLAPTTLSSGG
jgi:hypothetical protein